MKDDLANVNDEIKKPVEAKQDQNKSVTTAAKASASVVIPNTASSKLKDEEIGELKDLIKRISKEEDVKKKDVKKEDIVMNTTNEQKEQQKEQKQVDSKNDQKNELKNLINKISETIDKSETVDKKGKLDELDRKKDNKTKETTENKQSFWNDISEKLKDNKTTESEKINDIKKKNNEEKDSNSGILIKEKLPEVKKEAEEQEEKKEARKKFYGDDNYKSPENRLIFGKQKKYSSVSKRIKLKEKKNEIEDLKNTAEMKEKQKIISEKEKYKKLKNRVIKKYNIKLFLLPWKKIIPIAIVLIILSGAVYYILVKKFTEIPSEPPVIIVGIEIEKFTKIESVIEFTKKDLINTTNLEGIEINDKFNSAEEIGELRIVIRQDGNVIPLKETLESINIETENFPSDFWNTIDNSYNLFAFKTGENSFRFAIAIESNDITSLLKTMGDWEQETVDKRKMFNVFEPFFTDSKIEEDFYQHFEFANYEYTYIRYINLPDKNTSFDYFANDNTLIITTSKENTDRMINILNDHYNDDYYYSD